MLRSLVGSEMCIRDREKRSKVEEKDETKQQDVDEEGPDFPDSPGEQPDRREEGWESEEENSMVEREDTVWWLGLGEGETVEEMLIKMERERIEERAINIEEGGDERDKEKGRKRLMIHDQ